VRRFPRYDIIDPVPDGTAPSFDSRTAPPSIKPALLIRVSAVALLVFVLWLDSRTPVGIADPVVYVVPVLLFVWAGRWWEPLVAAAMATLLTFAGIYLSPPGVGVELAYINRPLAILTVWATAGFVAFYRVVVEQVTRQAARARTAAAESMERLEEIRYALDQSAIVAATDPRGIITYANDKFCEISKYSREELLGQDHRIINSGYHPKEFIRELWRTIAQGGLWRGEIRNRAKDGSIYWVDTTIVPLLDTNGKPRQYLAIRYDITQRKLAEGRLRDQAALTQLGQLAAVVAHEVRNPLAGVRGTLQVLLSRMPPDMRDRDIIVAMIERIDSLNAKVEDILVYARPSQPKLQSVDVKPLVVEAAGVARAATGSACPTLEITGQTGLIQADPDLLRPVLLNLLLNACQASAGQPIQVVTSDEGETCHISIRDRGRGIPAEERERIFEPFYTTKRGGTGLGLAVVKRLTELQGGSIALRDREGGGTVAELVLPRAKG
jgi:PAS domain S-box-containing protein